MFQQDICLHQSGKTLQIVGRDFCMHGSEGDIETLIWSSMAWTILITQVSFFVFLVCQQTRVRCVKISQLRQIVPNAEQCVEKSVAAFCPWSKDPHPEHDCLLLFLSCWLYCLYHNFWRLMWGCLSRVAVFKASTYLIATLWVFKWPTLASISVCMIFEFVSVWICLLCVRLIC